MRYVGGCWEERERERTEKEMRGQLRKAQAAAEEQKLVEGGLQPIVSDRHITCLIEHNGEQVSLVPSII